MRLGRKVSAPSPQPPTPSAEVLALRSNWKWAYLSHFLFTFNPILHLEDIQLSELEDDLASGSYSVIPTVMQRLLTSLTPHDKRMILEDWQQQLRKQSLKRSPLHDTIMGTENAPVDFKSLTMSEKLELFYRMCEWQFHNPNSLRSRMRDDDEYANWRIQPIAFGVRGNDYWLLGGNRLWKQNHPQRRAAPKTRKRKRITPETDGETTAVAGSSRRKQSTIEKLAPPPQTVVNNKATPISRYSTTLVARRPVRDTRSRAAGLPPTRPRIVGTRASSRLRGKEEEWQEVPEEWLKDSVAEASNPTGKEDSSDINEEDTSEFQVNEEEEKDGARFAFKLIDDGSELTSLSDLSELPDEESDKGDVGSDYDNSDTGHKKSQLAPEHSYTTSNEESWETVCVTLQDWEEFTKQFENSTNNREKAFYKLLVNELLPSITNVLKAEVKKQVMEDALMQRKRSSRLAMKESLREAEKAESRKRAEVEKELERHRRWEARVKKEEEEKLKLESMRSVRLKEKAGIFTDTTSNTRRMNVTSAAINTNGTIHDEGQVSSSHLVQSSSSKSGTQTPKEDEPWELDCEICHRRGWNLDDGEELMCCEVCTKWQHIRCHDQADFISGRPRRDWDSEEFVCGSCKTYTKERMSHQRLRDKPLEQPSRLQPQSSSANCTHLSKLQLRPSYQHPQSSYSLHPQQPYVSSQNWVMYNGNGTAGISINNGKTGPAGNDTTAGAPMVKSNDFCSVLPGPVQPVYGHDRPYVARHQSSVLENNHPVVPTTGVSPTLQPYQPMVRHVPSPSLATTHLAQRPNPSYSSPLGTYSPELSAHYPVPINISRHIASHNRPLGETLTQPSGGNLGHALFPELSSQRSEEHKTSHLVERFENVQENLGLQSNITPTESAVTPLTALTVTDSFHRQVSSTSIHTLPH